MKPYYQDDFATIYHGDCRDVVQDIAKPDCVITDPPYGLNFRNSEWDWEVPRFATELPTLFNRVAIIMGQTAIWWFPPAKWIACWARPTSSAVSKVKGFSHWTPILLYGECELSIDFKSWHAISNAYPHGFEHPSPKPECLMRWLVSELSEETDITLDPYMGSCTTLRAAKDLQRKAIGIEIEERYCEIAARRLQQEVLQFA